MVRFDLGPLLQGQRRIANFKSAETSLIKELFIFITMLLDLLLWIHLALGQRYVLGLVLFLFLTTVFHKISLSYDIHCTSVIEYGTPKFLHDHTATEICGSMKTILHSLFK